MMIHPFGFMVINNNIQRESKLIMQRVFINVYMFVWLRALIGGSAPRHGSITIARACLTHVTICARFWILVITTCVGEL